MITKDRHREIEARLARNRKAKAGAPICCICGEPISDGVRMVSTDLSRARHVGCRYEDKPKPKCDHKFVDSNHCLKCGWVPPSLGRVKKESGSIRILLDFWASEGVPEPQTEFVFHPTRKWRFDFAWSSWSRLGVALEVQGGVFTQGRHVRGAALLKEWEKLNEAAIAGWRILFCQPSELLTVETAQMIKRALGL